MEQTFWGASLIVLMISFAIILVFRGKLAKQTEELDELIKQSSTYYENRNAISFVCENKSCPLTQVRGEFTCDKARGKVNCGGFKEKVYERTN